eukprot:CAMPEP_0206233604 /NCGR_PEP_ID=MMETSP0047_2-20121206/12101_1 /ASSEMBLY_ACC=CAM_ASM_000192 /TAXON_ID=195065 /ORGANISM="Chroomonas mesostigmatica_cf, Strain CCMP1168" /LENGTH=51 /DNA_ID=CAMNT_0053657545 /DNA_START=93 /DNA_END=245 /DNA_ORIENTATION=-
MSAHTPPAGSLSAAAERAPKQQFADPKPISWAERKNTTGVHTREVYNMPRA